MWRLVSDNITAEAVSLLEARAQVYVGEEEADFDMSIEMLIASARAHVEAYCNRQFATHVMAWTCDRFADLARLPAAPVMSVTAVEYLDPDGVVQILSASAYNLCADGLDPSVELTSGQSWPMIALGSRITLRGVFGGICPPEVKHAMLLLIGDGFASRENAVRPSWTSVDALLSNHRRGAW